MSDIVRPAVGALGGAITQPCAERAPGPLRELVVEGGTNPGPGSRGEPEPCDRSGLRRHSRYNQLPHEGAVPAERATLEVSRSAFGFPAPALYLDSRA